MEPPDRISREQQLHDYLHSKFKYQASVLLQQLLTFDTLATLNDRAVSSGRTGTDAPFPSPEETSLLHSVGRFLMMQIDLWYNQVEFFEEVRSSRTATALQVSRSKELYSIFKLVNAYGGISSQAMYTASTVAAGSYPIESLTAVLPKRRLWTEEIEDLCQRMREEKDPIPSTTFLMTRWKDYQELDIPVVLSGHRLWREGHTSMPSSPRPASGAIDEDARSPSTSGPSSSSGSSVFKQVYKLGPLEGRWCGFRASCEINKESVEVLFSGESSHSYMSRSAVKRLNIAVTDGGWVRVKVANGKPLKTREYVCKCPIAFRSRVFKTDLIVLPFRECDVVLGKDWQDSCQHFFADSDSVSFLRDGVNISFPE